MKQRVFAWLLIAIVMLFARGGYLEDVIYNIDEAEYAVSALAWDHGWLPGADLLGSTKPPAIVLLYDFLFHLFGKSLAVIHVAHLLLMIGGGLLLVELALSLWGEKAAIPAALLYGMICNSFDIPPEILALNVESPGMVFTILALWLIWSKPSSRWPLMAGGFALGIAVLFRQSFLVFAFPILAVILTTGAAKIRRLSLIAAGALLPWLPIVGIYMARGDLLWAWDSWVRYPFTYAGDPGLRGFIWGLYHTGSSLAFNAAVPVAFAIGGIVVLWKQGWTGRTIFLLTLIVVSVFSVFIGSRFFGHYFIQLFPAIALLGVPAWFALLESRANRGWLIAGVAIGILVAALHFPMWPMWDDYATKPGVSFYRLSPTNSDLKVAAFAREHTKPDETITVWGYCPQIYYYAGRLPGTRDFLCHYTTGFSPGTFDPQTEQAVRPFGHPQAQQMFVEDLELRKPKYIFDLVQVREYCFTFYNYSIRQYPDLADYIREHYLPEGQIDNVMIYRRRTAEDKWWPMPEEVE
jgi:hypothetical protein